MSNSAKAPDILKCAGAGATYGLASSIWKISPGGPEANLGIRPLAMSSHVYNKTVLGLFLGGLFGAGVAVAGTLRNKEDNGNYAFGGALLGGFVGIRNRGLHGVVAGATVVSFFSFVVANAYDVYAQKNFKRV